MGSSKKHKEKRDRKKHKRDRSRSRERDILKKSHKSSHRREKRKSPEHSESEIDIQLINRARQFSGEEEISQRELEKPSTSTVNFASDEEFDVDKLLDSKLSESAEFSSVLKRPSKKRRREGALEELRKRQNLGTNEDSLEKFATEQLFEEHGVPDSISKRNRSPHRSVETSFQDVKIKEERHDEVRAENPDRRSSEGRNEPKLSIADTNKLRAKLGLKPLGVAKERSSGRKENAEVIAANKLREKLGLKPPSDVDEVPENSDIQSSLSVSEKANKLRTKLGLRPSDTGHEPPDVEIEPSERSEPQLSLSTSESNKHRAKLGLKPLDVGNEIPERSEPQLSLSISETNKLRAKLGLKPLDVGNEIPGLDDGDPEKEISKPAAEIFVKTENIREKKKSEALREKLRVVKEKRKIEEKLKKTKGIADSDSEDESAAAWVVKHQKILQEKETAEKRAKLLEEMDAEFGIDALVEEEFDKKKAYTSQHLKGLTIAHDMDAFAEGHQVILTLKDKGVLEEEDDVLENVNIVDSERYAKNVENKKKKPDYRPYEEPEFDEFGILKKKNLLSKYDEEIEGEKKKAFKIGNVSNTAYMSKEQELELIRMKLKQQHEMSLEMPELKVANEYYTTEDMVQFKKPKKRKKVKKPSLLKADDLMPDTIEERDFGSRRRTRRREIDPEDEDGAVNPPPNAIPLIHEELDTKMDVSDVIEEDQAEKELHGALSKARKLKERRILATAPEKVMEILNSVDETASNGQKASKNEVNIELNSVAEFCRTLGEIPTYGMSGNRDEEADDMMDLERDLLEEREKQELEAQNQGAWNEVDIEEKPAEILMRENEPILEEEPDISLGVAGALKLATKKGYLDKEDQIASSAPRSSQLQAQSYTIEEKFYEDDKFGKRDRYTGPVQDFREKSNYKPDVKLEYIDDSGRLLTAKEAFRYLSHKFHGKGPGKNKVDKRMKKLDQDNRLKQMSSTDTPLNTVKLLQLKQKETQSPYIVLSGGNKTLTQTMISKTKH